MKVHSLSPSRVFLQIMQEARKHHGNERLSWEWTANFAVEDRGLYPDMFTINLNNQFIQLFFISLDRSQKEQFIRINLKYESHSYYG